MAYRDSAFQARSLPDQVEEQCADVAAAVVAQGCQIGTTLAVPAPDREAGAAARFVWAAAGDRAAAVDPAERLLGPRRIPEEGEGELAVEMRCVHAVLLLHAGFQPPSSVAFVDRRASELVASS